MDKTIADEIVSKLQSLEPNKVITLSEGAGRHFLETIREMKENGEI